MRSGSSLARSSEEIRTSKELFVNEISLSFFLLSI